MRFFILSIIILLIVAVPMLILVVWFIFEFDTYRYEEKINWEYRQPVTQTGYFYPEAAWRPQVMVSGNRWLLELMDTENGHRVRKVFVGQLILGRNIGKEEPTGWLYLSEERTISRRQCRLSNTAMGIFIENLSDVNVTRLNGLPIHSPKRILPGDYLSFGGRQYWVTNLQRCA